MGGRRRLGMVGPLHQRADYSAGRVLGSIEVGAGAPLINAAPRVDADLSESVSDDIGYHRMPGFMVGRAAPAPIPWGCTLSTSPHCPSHRVSRPVRWPASRPEVAGC